MASSAIERLMRPRSIAVVGASEGSRVGRGSIENLERLGFGGTIYPVNPKHQTVLGLQCYPSLDAIPGDLDAVLVATQAAQAIAVLEQCANKGVGGAVVSSDGFRERGAAGAELETRLRDIAREAGIALCGPNCMGILNLANGGALYIGVLERPMRRGSVAAVLQSGSLGLALANNDRGLDFRYLISSGNEAVTTAADYVEFLAEDDGTSVIALVLEAVRDPRRLLAGARSAILAGKPVVLLKLGKSDKGRSLAASHTGALAGSRAVTESICREYGITCVDDLEELMCVCALLSQSAPPRGARAGAVTLSGGSGVLFADLATDEGLQLPEWQDDTGAVLQSLIARPAPNPVDAWSGGDFASAARSAAMAAASDGGTDFTVLLQDLPPESAPHRSDVPSAVIDIALQTQRASGDKPVIVWGSVWARPDPHLIDDLRSGHVPYLTGGRPAMRALAAWAKQSGARDAARHSKVASPDGSEAATEVDRRTLMEHGIPMIQEEFAADAAAAEAAARRLGYPVVMKIVSPQVLHKSDVGGVIRGLHAGEVRPAYERLMATVAQHLPRARLLGALVQPDAPPGLEIMIGAVRDPDWGWVVTCALGGVHVEVLQDRTFRRAPVDAAEAARMLRELKGWPLLSGHRGSEALDVDAIADLIAKFSSVMAGAAPSISQVDLNPVLVYRKGEAPVVVDCLVVQVGDLVTPSQPLSA